MVTMVRGQLGGFSQYASLNMITGPPGNSQDSGP